MVKLIAVTEVYYASKTRWPGDEFEASEQDAHILTAPDLPGGQKARRAESNQPAPKPAPRPPAPQPAPATPPIQAHVMTTENAAPLAPRRRYTRRNGD